MVNFTRLTHKDTMHIFDGVPFNPIKNEEMRPCKRCFGDKIRLKFILKLMLYEHDKKKDCNRTVYLQRLSIYYIINY